MTRRDSAERLVEGVEAVLRDLVRADDDPVSYSRIVAEAAKRDGRLVQFVPSDDAAARFRYVDDATAPAGSSCFYGLEAIRHLRRALSGEERKRIQTEEASNRARRDLEDFALRELMSGARRDFENAAEIVNREAMDQQSSGSRPVLRSVIRRALCPSLKSFTGDVFELAKVSTPILLSLSMVGTIQLPAQPLVIGMIVMFIARGGVATVCKDSDVKPPERGKPPS